MSILVDRPRWLWRGQRWSHLVSDTDIDELHSFANDLGLRRLAFQGDHYDLPQSRLEAAQLAGATVVDSRVLVRRLRESGLRHRQSMGWEPALRWSEGDHDTLRHRLGAAAALPPSIPADLDKVTASGPVLAVMVLRRHREWGVGVTAAHPPTIDGLPATPRRWIVADDRGHHVDWLLPDTGPPS